MNYKRYIICDDNYILKASDNCYDDYTNIKYDHEELYDEELENFSLSELLNRYYM